MNEKKKKRNVTYSYEMVKVDRSIVPTNGMDLLDVHRVDQLDVHQDDPSNLVAFVVHHDRLHVEDREDVAHDHQTLPDVVVDHRTVSPVPMDRASNHRL